MVLDTSVLIADPGCIGTFTDVDLVVPLTVIEELDGLKNRLDDVGRSARAALRAIEDLRVSNGGTLAEPMTIGSCTLQIEINSVQKHRLVEHGLDPANPDNRIIGAALGQAERGPTTMLSNDAALRIKAAHLGVIAAEHRRTGRQDHSTVDGWASFEIDSATVDRLYRDGSIVADDVDGVGAIVDNEFAVLRAGSQSALARRVGDSLVAVVAQRSRGVGPPRPLQGAALRPRTAARPGDRGRRPRRPSRHRQDRAGDRGRIRAGRRVQLATSVSPSIARWSRSAGPTSATSPAVSTRSSTRGCRRSTMQWWPSPIIARAATLAGWSRS